MCPFVFKDQRHFQVFLQLFLPFLINHKIIKKKKHTQVLCVSKSNFFECLLSHFVLSPNKEQ